MSETHKANMPCRRVEDEAFVTGRGRYADDIAHEDVAYAAFVRSPHAAARIVSLDAAAARGMDGVLAVLTAADMSGVGSVVRHPPVAGRGGAKPLMSHRPVLAGERVVHVGEAVAMVVATSPQAAQDAAESIAVEYAESAAVVDLEDAQRHDAPLVFPDIPGNLAVEWPGTVADPEANAHEVSAIIAAAAHVARVSLRQQRLVVASMEMRGATASHDAASGRYTLRVGTQGAGPVRDALLAIMNLDKDRLRVVTEDVGGAFGMKSGVYPEYAALLVAAQRTGRTVHWMASRSEAFSSDNQGRDSLTDAELALDERGRFLALRVRHAQNLGAYVTSAGIMLATINFGRCLPGVYRIPRIDVVTRCLYTNTMPTGAYRGAGRPEANYLLERLIDEAARTTGIDRTTLRRRNFIPPSAMPCKTAVGNTYDSGDFPAVFAKALALADYDGFRKRRREAKAKGLLRGLGLSCFLEHSGGVPTEGALLAFPGDGTIVLGLNVQSTGQGHATVFPRLVAQRLGVPADRIRHRHGDSDLEIKGFPSVASRSTITAGGATVHATETMLRKGRAIASHVLEAAEKDIAYRNGVFEVSGTDRRIGLFELAEQARALAKSGAIAEDLDTKVATDTPQAFPNGCHIAEVEIDPQTGTTRVVAYIAVDDCGNVLDPLLAEGQIHGGVAQGLGQALLENAVYDRISGQIVTGSFMDYAMPRAHDMPADLREAMLPVPAATNPLGVKGIGEAGTTASIGAIMNAIADAIPEGAAAHMDMPATPEKIWRACRKAQQG
ncbi:MAG: carbon monoxide dehydrogenase [Alphaproteobacteria bacterium]|nr:MAG: carbon monoxide dehydrogenase [Alphaproteobacteria bacterium]